MRKSTLAGGASLALAMLAAGFAPAASVVADGARASSEARSQPATQSPATGTARAAAMLGNFLRSGFGRRQSYPKNAGWTDRRYRRAAAKKRCQARARKAAR